jgi:hypothetical protein
MQAISTEVEVTETRVPAGAVGGMKVGRQDQGRSEPTCI